MTTATVDSTGAPLPAADAIITTGPGRSALRRILAQRPALIGLTILAFLFAVAVFADVLAAYDPDGLLFVNVNTPHDYERARDLIESLPQRRGDGITDKHFPS